MRSPVVLLLVGLAATLGQTRVQASQDSAVFPFSRYPARETLRGRPAPVDLASDPAARRFRTVLRGGAERGPNFAGAYTIVTWGCGTNCRQLAIVSARSGAVHFAPFTVEYELHYRRSSALLVVDPYACGFTRAELPGPRWRHLYQWTGGALVLVDSLRVPSGHAC